MFIDPSNLANRFVYDGDRGGRGWTCAKTQELCASRPMLRKIRHGKTQKTGLSEKDLRARMGSPRKLQHRPNTLTKLSTTTYLRGVQVRGALS